MHLSLQRDGEALHVQLVGNWRGPELPAIDAELASQSFGGARELVVSVPESVELDLAVKPSHAMRQHSAAGSQALPPCLPILSHIWSGQYRMLAKESIN